MNSKKSGFWPLFWTQFLGAFNDNLFKNALIILIAFKTKEVLGIPSSAMAVVCGGIFIFPFFAFSATSGQLADKYDKGRIVRIVRGVEIPLMIVAAVGFLFPSYAFLLFVLFMLGVHSTLFGPVKYSILPQLLPEEELVRGNALVEAGTFLAILLGTIAGGLLVAIDPGGPWIVSAVLLAVAVAGWLFSLGVPKLEPAAPELEVQWNPIPPTKEVYRFTRQHRALWLSVLGISWFWFFGAAFLSLFAPMCKDLFKTTETVATLFLAMFSIGIAIGSMLCERLSHRRLELGLVPAGSIGMSLMAFDLCHTASKLGALRAAESLAPIGVPELLGLPFGIHLCLDLLLISVAGGFFIVPLYTLIQERCVPEYRSRIVASNNILNAVFMVVASVVLVVMMLAKLSIPQMFLVIGALNAAVAVYIYNLMPEFWLRFMAWILANTMYRLRVIGEENIPEHGAAILVCNHVSFIDWLVIFGAVKRPVRFVMTQKFARGFIGRWLVKRGKVIPIAGSKEDRDLMERAFARVASELREGEIVCIFPEGMITLDGKMSPFRPGIERALRETPVPVVPMALRGLWGSFFSKSSERGFFRRVRSRVELVIGEPVPADQASAAALQEKVAALWGDDR